MSCCGHRRAQAAGTMPNVLSGANPRRAVSLPVRTALFEYVGTTAMTVVGPITGKRYVFHADGARLAVDVRDAQYVRQVPMLREVRNS